MGLVPTRGRRCRRGVRRVRAPGLFALVEDAEDAFGGGLALGTGVELSPGPS